MPAYPYTSSLGALPKAFAQFRKSMPTAVNAQTLQKFGIAPNNESYVINTIRFLGLIDSDGKKIEENTEFLFSDDAAFRSGLEARIKAAYAELFNDFGNEAFETDRAALTTWFRTTDKTTEIVGGRQASTFLTLAAIAGHGEPLPVEQAASSRPVKKRSTKTTAKESTRAAAPASAPSATADIGSNAQTDPLDPPVGLTVRIEVTLPANGTPEVYDSIFASVRKHLIDRA